MNIENTLNTIGLKWKKVGSEISVLCPFHNDSKNSLYINVNSGKWHCFGCGSKGRTFNSFLRKLGRNDLVSRDNFIEIGKPKAKYFHKNNGKNKRIVIESSADEEIEKYFVMCRGFGEHEYNKLLDNFKFSKVVINGDVYVRFPIFTFSGFQVGSVIRDIHKKIYMNSRGLSASSILYGEWMVDKDADYVVLVEGIFDMMKVWLAGFPSLAVLGLMGSTRKLIRLRNYLKNLGRIVFLFDSDVKDDVYDEWVFSSNLCNFDYKIVKIDSGDPGDKSVEELTNILRG